MYKSTTLCVLVLLLWGCSPDKNKTQKIDELRFNTTDASELFFKNVRRSDYTREDLAQAKMEIYRYARLQADSALLSPALIINWATDHAFLMLEKSENLPEDFEIIIGNDASSGETLSFDDSQQRLHAELAIRIYNAILEKHEIWINVEGETRILLSGSEKEKFRKIVYDFLRLVELR